MKIRHAVLATSILLPGSTLGAQTVRDPGTPPLASEQHYLAGRFRLQLEHAVAPGATPAARAALVTFLRKEVLPYLGREGAAVYPVVDSIAGDNGYATIAASLDQADITRRVDRLAAQENAKSPTRFVGEAYALAGLLDSYFEREQYLIQPILRSDLSRKEIAALRAQVHAAVEAGPGT